MRRRLLAGLLAVLPVLGLAGCGTGAFPSTFVVDVEDADGTLPPGPVRISVFDSGSGNTRDWAMRSLGTSSPGQPYTATVTSVETRLIGSSGPARQVRAGLYLPDYRERGWYALDLAPVDGTEQVVSAPFVAWDGLAAFAEGVAPLQVRVTATADGDTWRLATTAVLIGPAPDESRPPATTDARTLELIAAAGRGDLEVVKDLIIRGAELNGADAEGTTALHAAAGAGERDTVSYLLQLGAAVDIVDADGATALHRAVADGGCTLDTRDIVAFLRSSGADVNRPDGSGRAPLDLAESAGCDLLVQSLTAAGAVSGGSGG